MHTNSYLSIGYFQFQFEFSVRSVQISLFVRISIKILSYKMNIWTIVFVQIFLKNKGVKTVSINPRIDRVYLFASSYYQYWYIPNVGLKEVVKIKKCGCKCIWFLSCLALPPEQSALEHISSTVLSFYYFLN